MANDYWKKRMEAIEQMTHDKGIAYANHIDRQFRIAERNIQDKINVWYGRIAENNGISFKAAKDLLRADELEDFHMTVEEYIAKGEKMDFDNRWMKQLENASAKVHISRLEALKLQMQQECEVLYGNMTDGLDKTLTDIYTENYYHTAYEFMKGHGVGWGFNKLDTRKIESALTTAWMYDNKTFSDRIWANKQRLTNELNNIITQSFIRGDSPQKAIDLLSKRMKTSRYNAGRLIMTESSAISMQAQKGCFNELGVSKFEFVATLDSHTSDICRSMDGKVFDMSEYKIGVTVPPLHCFCRSVVVPYYEDDFGSIGERAARGEDGKTYHVPANMKYEDWKKTFVDGGTKIELKPVEKGSTIVATTLAEKIQAIKDRCKGEYTEKDLKEAGAYVREEMEKLREPLQKRFDEAKAKYDSFGYDKLIEEKKELSKVNRGLMDPEEIGYKTADEVMNRYREVNKAIDELMDSPEMSKANLEKMKAEHELKGSKIQNAAELKAKLSEIRDMGGINTKAHLSNSRSPMRPIVEQAYDCYPTEWVQKSIERGKLSVKKVDRGYYSDFDSTIAISGWNDEGSFGTAIHELGHRFERAVPEIKEAEKIFYERRTAGEPLQWLGGGYSYSEKSRFDHFIEKYMGKDYGGSAYELVSMGFQYAYTEPLTLWQDKDMADWIYGILALR